MALSPGYPAVTFSIFTETPVSLALEKILRRFGDSADSSRGRPVTYIIRPALMQPWMALGSKFSTELKEPRREPAMPTSMVMEP